MSETGARAAIVRSALEAAVTGDEALVERVYTDDVTGWSPTATASAAKGSSPTSTWHWTRSTRSATR